MAIRDPFALVLPDTEFDKPFRAYANYVRDLAGLISGLHGFAPTLVEGVYRAAEAEPAIRAVPGRPLNERRSAAVAAALRKAWGTLRRMDAMIEDFEEESNAWLPAMAYQAVYHSVQALAVASRQDVPRTHRHVLNLASKEVQRGLLPFPWSATCVGCPQTGTAAFTGIAKPDTVHVLSTPTPETAEGRLAMLLRTTRAKELDRRFAEDRSRNVAPGARSRRLSRDIKERAAGRLAPTTLIDVSYRLRKKAQYEDADVFVLGAAGPVDAQSFSESLALVSDATVAALDAATGAYTGPAAMADVGERYLARIRSDHHLAVVRRTEAWTQRSGPRSRVPFAVR
jgi:hypothetical protein